jgi:hypothetical protein
MQRTMQIPGMLLLVPPMLKYKRVRVTVKTNNSSFKSLYQARLVAWG